MRLSEHLGDVRETIRRAGKVWVGCDFDGTLAPLVDDPWAAALDPVAAEALARLAATPAASVAIISGRALGDLRPRITVPDVAFAGNHGAEIDAPGLQLIDPTAEAASPALRTAHGRLTESPLRRAPGVTINDKTYSIAVDYRATPSDARGPIRECVEVAAAGLTGLHFHHGLHGSEIRATGGWNKGSAATRLLLHQAGPEAVPIFLGDDRTDEDAFAALPDGITVCVGDHPTVARYRVVSEKAVATFLSWLATECGRMGLPHP